MSKKLNLQAAKRHARERAERVEQARAELRYRNARALIELKMEMEREKCAQWLRV